MIKAIHASEDVVAAREKAIRVIEKLLGLRLTRAAELVETAFEETLSYYAFPEEHWRRIRTNNPLERIPREISGVESRGEGVHQDRGLRRGHRSTGARSRRQQFQRRRCGRDGNLHCWRAGNTGHDIDVSITDADSTLLESATITIGINRQSGDELIAGTLPTGITASSYSPFSGVAACRRADRCAAGN